MQWGTLGAERVWWGTLGAEPMQWVLWVLPLRARVLPHRLGSSSTRWDESRHEIGWRWQQPLAQVHGLPWTGFGASLRRGGGAGVSGGSGRAMMRV